MDANEKKEREPNEVEKLEKNIQHAEVPVSVELGQIHYLYSRLFKLDIGDVIELNQSIEDPLID